MNKYLTRLNVLIQQKPLSQLPSKPSKGAFEVFDGSFSSHVHGVNDDARRPAADTITTRRTRLNCTDRYCHCKNLATLAIGRSRATQSNTEGIGRWLCQEHFNTWVKSND